MTNKPYVAATDYGTRGSQKDKHVIPFGDLNVTLYRRTDVANSSWFFRVHIKQEDRNFRKSLGTDDLVAATKAAQREIIKILAKVESGQRILALVLKDLVRQFSLHMEKMVELEQIAPTTWVSQRYRIGLGLEFLKTKYPAGLETKVTDIDGEVFHSYLDWRIETLKAKEKTIRRDVVRDELLVIRKMFTYAQKEKMCTARSIPNWDFIVEKQGPTRERINAKQFNEFSLTLLAWVKEAYDKQSWHNRSMTMQIINLVGMSGLRSGEVFGLRNKDIQFRGNECILGVRAKTSKVRRDRQVTMPMTLLKFWIKKQKFTEDTDFLFSPFDTGTTPARDTFYHQYKLLREKLKTVNLEWFDLYHCRHWWITNRLLAQEPIHLVARAAGTSVKEIEKTYSHVMTEITTRGFNKKRVVHRPDGTFEIVVEEIKKLATSN
jgi:integrase